MQMAKKEWMPKEGKCTCDKCSAVEYTSRKAYGFFVPKGWMLTVPRGQVYYKMYCPQCK